MASQQRWRGPRKRNPRQQKIERRGAEGLLCARHVPGVERSGVPWRAQSDARDRCVRSRRLHDVGKGTTAAVVILTNASGAEWPNMWAVCRCANGRVCWRVVGMRGRGG